MATSPQFIVLHRPVVTRAPANENELSDPAYGGGFGIAFMALVAVLIGFALVAF